MRDKSKPGLRFYAPSAEAQVREAMLRAHERGVEWNQINELLIEHREDAERAETVPDLLDQLEPEQIREDEIDESATSPSLDDKREAWMRLNRAFK
jgi:hypothetical protein